MQDNHSLTLMDTATVFPNKSFQFVQFENCYILQFIGYYFISVSIIGTFLNGALLYTLIRNERLHGLSTNILLGGLFLADLIGAFVAVPLPALSLIHCRWIWSNIGCKIEAFITYFVGCSNIYILCFISIDRYSIVTRSAQLAATVIRRAYLYIFFAYALSLFWTITPLLGWSSYVFEGLGTSCSLNWVDRSFNVISYNVASFIIVYFMPVITILITNAKIYQIIRVRRRAYVAKLHRVFVQRRHQIEHRILITIIYVVGGFLTAWTPYAIVALIQILHLNTHISSIMITIPALFAKTSFVWNPLILILRDGNFRQFLPLIPYKRHDDDHSQYRSETTNRTLTSSLK